MDIILGIHVRLLWHMNYDSKEMVERKTFSCKINIMYPNEKNAFMMANYKKNVYNYENFGSFLLANKL